MLPALRARGHTLAFLYEFQDHSSETSADGAADLDARWCVAEIGTDAAVRKAAEWRPDVVWVHGLTDPVLERNLLERFACVLQVHGYYGTCATGTKWHSFPPMRACKRRLGAACLPINFVRGCGIRNPAALWRQYTVQEARAVLRDRYAAVVVCSRHMYDEFARHGVDAKRLHHAPYPTTSTKPDSEPPRPRAPTGSLLFLGRITSLKGLPVAMEAMAIAARSLPFPLRLAVGGDGPDLARSRAVADRWGVSVSFKGWVEEAEKTALLRDADLLLVPSVWSEPFGLVGLEAGAVGVPAAGFDVGGIGEWLQPGVSGELAPGDPPSAQGLADAIMRALGDPSHYADLRLGAWRSARQFTTDAHVAALIPVLEAAAG